MSKPVCRCGHSPEVHIISGEYHVCQGGRCGCMRYRPRRKGKKEVKK